MDPDSWASADKLLHHKKTGGRLERRKVANNTYLERRPSGDIAVKLHATDVVTYHDDGTFSLQTGGWYSVTTKERMNRFMPLFDVASRRGQWKIYIRNREYNAWRAKEERHKIEYRPFTLPMILADLRGETVELWTVRNLGTYNTHDEAKAAQEAKIGTCPDYWVEIGDYYDGIRLDPAHPERYLKLSGMDEIEEYDENIIRLVNRYMNNLTKTKWDEVLSNSDLGDCFMCRAASAFSDEEHLLSHLEERYYMRTLAWNAIAESGYRPEIYISDLKMVKRQLRKYFLSRLLKGNRQGRVGTKIEYKKGSWYS